MIKDHFKLGEYKLAMCCNLEYSIENINKDIEDFFWIDIDNDSEILISQAQLYNIYKLIENYKCGDRIQLTDGEFKCCVGCFAFEDLYGIGIRIEFGDETARLKDWIYNTLKELGYEKFNEKANGEVVKSIEIESNIISAIRLDDIKYFYVDEDGLQNIFKDKEVFKRYELQIGLTIAKKGILWIVTPIKK